MLEFRSSKCAYSARRSTLSSSVITVEHTRRCENSLRWIRLTLVIAEPCGICHACSEAASLMRLPGDGNPSSASAASTSAIVEARFASRWLANRGEPTGEAYLKTRYRWRRMTEGDPA